MVCNPPYMPLEAWESVAAEARDHDPHLALFSGTTDSTRSAALERRSGGFCCSPEGVVGFEHADAQGESAPAVFGPPVVDARFATTGTWPGVPRYRPPGWHYEP